MDGFECIKKTQTNGKLKPFFEETIPYKLDCITLFAE